MIWPAPTESLLPGGLASLEWRMWIVLLAREGAVMLHRYSQASKGPNGKKREEAEEEEHSEKRDNRCGFQCYEHRMTMKYTKFKTVTVKFAF